MATFTVAGPIVLTFGLLVDPPNRETRQTISERVVPGSNDIIVDIIGRSITKIRGRARIDGFSALQTIEGAVGLQGTLVYSEYVSGVSVILVSLERVAISTRADVHICNIEFWITV